jgi:hypothetical protein
MEDSCSIVKPENNRHGFVDNTFNLYNMGCGSVSHLSG